MKIISILAVVLLGTSLCASAQFTGGGAKTGNSARARIADTNSYNRLSISYDNTNLSANDKLKKCFNGEDDMSLNGFGLEHTHGFSVSKTLPMFIEAGIKAQMGFGSVSQDGKYISSDYKMQQLSFSIPINYTYRFALGNNVTLAPYLGLNFKLHAMGRTKYEVDNDYDYEDYRSRSYDYDDWEDYYDWGYYDDDEEEEEAKWANLFDKKDMGSKDATWNRFQLGWQIGLGFNYKAFYLGLQYGTDFIPAYKYKKQSVNSGTFSAKIGFNF